MARVTTGAYQATGKKMEGTNQQSNFAKPAKIAPIKATEALPPSANPKPFDRAIMPGVRGPSMRRANAGGIARSDPTQVSAGVHDVMPHVRNPGE